MSQRKKTFILLGGTFLIERTFGLALLPMVVLVLGIYQENDFFWFLVGLLAILSDLFSGLTLGIWGISYLPPIILVILILKVSQLTPQTLVLSSLGFGVAVLGGFIKDWLIGGYLLMPSPPVLLVEGIWSLLFAFGFRFLSPDLGEEDLILRY